MLHSVQVPPQSRRKHNRILLDDQYMQSVRAVLVMCHIIHSFCAWKNNTIIVFLLWAILRFVQTSEKCYCYPTRDYCYSIGDYAFGSIGVSVRLLARLLKRLWTDSDKIIIDHEGSKVVMNIRHKILVANRIIIWPWWRFALSECFV